jgi:GNAT acetyltransferase-like protein
MGRKLKVFITPMLSQKDFDFGGLKQSCNQDKLFNSFVWLNAWWKRWGVGFIGVVMLVKDGDNIVSNLPLYIDNFKLGNTLSIKRLQFIGTNYKNISTPRAEYLAFGAASSEESTIVLALEKLKVLDWDEFVARDIVVGEYTDIEITSWAKRNKWLTRVIHRDTSYYIDTKGDFDIYKKGLGSNSRLQLFNRRKLLCTIGEPELSNYYPDQITDFFKLLNGFHTSRWGEGFSNATLLFHEEVMKSALISELNVELSVLKVDGVCESVMFNYILDGRIYNISSGFNEKFHKKIAIGMIHFGYLIESAFDNFSIEKFDFLAGKGKKSNYKSRLATNAIEMYSLQIVRSKVLSSLYRAKSIIASLRIKLLSLNFLFVRKMK